MSWREYWNADTPIYVSERHKALHYAAIASDILRYVPGRDAQVLDHGSGEALAAGRIAERCGTLFLCDGAPLVRSRLERRFGDVSNIRILSPEGVDDLPDESLDLVVVNSLLQYLTHDEFTALIGTWRTRLKPGGRLVLADVIPTDASPWGDIAALLRFAGSGGFLLAALAGLARTAVSDYRKLRAEIGLTQYGEAEMLGILRERGFRARRAELNMGHNGGRMTFVADKE